MPKVVLEAVNLSKAFNKPILTNLDLTIKERETHVIMGTSGEGKSTLLKILAGLTAPDKGEVSFMGEALENPEEVLVAGHEELAYVAQNFSLLHNRTVLENLKDALLAFKDDFASQQIERLLHLMRLQKMKDQKIERLSGGEKQRLAIARALATQPTVLLLDEPFTQLDFPTRQVLLEAVQEVKSELETSIILVSHNQYEAFYLADKVHILKNGRLIRSGDPLSIYQQPQYVSVANLLNEVNIIPERTLGDWQLEIMGIWPENIQLLSPEQDNISHFLTLELTKKRFIGTHYRYQFKFLNDRELVVNAVLSKYEVGKTYSLAFPQSFLFPLHPF